MKMKKNTDAAAIIVLNAHRDILLQKKDEGYRWFPTKWCLFGGGIEDGENPEDCGRRELKEEIGYDAGRLGSIIMQDTYSNSCGAETRQGRVYVFEYNLKVPLSKLSIGEGAGIAFFSRREIEATLAEDLINKDDLRILRDYLGIKTELPKNGNR